MFVSKFELECPDLNEIFLWLTEQTALKSLLKFYLNIPNWLRVIKLERRESVTKDFLHLSLVSIWS